MLGEKDRVSVWSWIFTFIVLAIPIVNIIYFIVLLFGGSKYESKVTFIRAIFLTSLIGIVLLVVFGVLALGGMQELINKIIEYIKQVVEAIKNGNIMVI